MQTWKTSTLPDKWQASQDAIKKHLVGWAYVLMTDDDNLIFVRKYFPDFLNTYNSFPYPIQRADAIRYLWFYVNGGLYLDLDIEILKPLDPLFYVKADVYVVKSLYVSTTYTNAFMACQKGSMIMLKCIDLMIAGIQPYQSITKHLYVINTTGPNMYTRAIELTKQKYLSIKIEELPQDLIINEDSVYVNPEGRYSRNLGGSSWSGNDTKVLLFAHTNKHTLAFIIFIVIVILCVWIKSKRRNF